MSVYVIAQISIHDRAAYNRYESKFMDVFEKFRGRLLAVDENPEVLEGEWHGTRIVLLHFPDKQAFEEWAFSPEYQEIAKDRHAGSDGIVLLVKSID